MSTPVAISAAARAAASSDKAGSHSEGAPGPSINLGWRLKLGVLHASVNTVAEPQMQAMAPEGVSLHSTRLKLVGSTEEEVLKMADDVEDAARLLADAQVDRILFHCTATTTHDPGQPDAIGRRITVATGIPATTTGEAVAAALAALGARNVVLVTPYIQEINDREVAFLRHRGIAVTREHGLGLPGGIAFREVEPAAWYRIVMEYRDEAADAYFISCANVRAAEVIETLESDLGRPVVTSNTAAMWRCLRQSGITDRIAGFGTLLRAH
jgi:maleate isomerase